MTLVLQSLGRDQSLDLWCLGVWLLAFAFGLDLATDDILPDLSFGSRLVSAVVVSLFLISHTLPNLLRYHHRRLRVGDDRVL
jgi:hypothetical protein